MSSWMSRTPASSSEVADSRTAGPKPRFSLSMKIILFLAAVLIPVAA